MEILYDSNKLYFAGFSFWVLKLIILIFRFSKYSKIFQITVAQVKKGTVPPFYIERQKQCKRASTQHLCISLEFIYTYISLANPKWILRGFEPSPVIRINICIQTGVAHKG